MILFEDVSKMYRGAARPALSNVSINIDAGEFVFLVGASGSGKSSLLRLILKEERPNSGNIHVLGQDLRRIPSRKVPQLVQNASIMRNAGCSCSARLWFLCCENVYVPASCHLWRLDQHCAAGR